MFVKSRFIYFKGDEVMPSAVETMFYARETPWHGLGIRVGDALDSKEALEMAGLDWRGEPKANNDCKLRANSRLQSKCP